MGWASGSELMEACIISIKKHVPNRDRRFDVYRDMIQAFEDQDCDTLEECLGMDKEFDSAYNSLHDSDPDGN